jgi:hypothetical protein
MCMSQRAMSCCLYKHRSQLIDGSPIIESIQFTFILVFTLFSSFSSFSRLDIVFVVMTPWVIVVLAYHSSRRRLAGGEALSLSDGDAPDYHWN